MNRLTMAAVIVCAALGAVGCSKQERTASSGVTAQDVKREATEAVDTTTQYAQQEKAEFIRNAEHELAEMKANLDELNSRAQAASGESKARLETQVVALQSKWRAAESKLNEAKAAAAPTWADAKASFAQSMQELKQTLEDSKRQG